MMTNKWKPGPMPKPVARLYQQAAEHQAREELKAAERRLAREQRGGASRQEQAQEERHG